MVSHGHWQAISMSSLPDSQLDFNLEHAIEAFTTRMKAVDSLHWKTFMLTCGQHGNLTAKSRKVSECCPNMCCVKWQWVSTCLPGCVSRFSNRVSLGVPGSNFTWQNSCLLPISISLISLRFQASSEWCAISWTSSWQCESRAQRRDFLFASESQICYIAIVSSENLSPLSGEHRSSNWMAA